MENFFTQVFRKMKQPSGRVVVLQEWNQAMYGEMKRHPELRERGLCVQLKSKFRREKPIKPLVLFLKKEWKNPLLTPLSWTDCPD